MMHFNLTMAELAQVFHTSDENDNRVKEMEGLRIRIRTMYCQSEQPGRCLAAVASHPCGIFVKYMSNRMRQIRV